jgi:GT2 family glycosyltransferase
VNFIIVDSSTPPINLEQFILSSKIQKALTRVKLIYEKPGIPRARNKALKEIDTDLVCFVDDDITLPSNFSELILEHFNSHPQTVGVGPRIVGMYETLKVDKNDGYFSQVYKRRLTNSYGRITKYGENFWFPESHTTDLDMCEWLPGCCMTYNFRILKNLVFNTCLENGPGKSYAVGEDVDFSTRASEFGPLYLLSSLLIEHREEPGTRDNSIVMAKARGSFRAFLTYEKRISLIPTLYHLALNLLSSLVRTVLRKADARKKLDEDSITLVFFISEFFLRNLNKDKSATL